MLCSRDYAFQISKFIRKFLFWERYHNNHLALQSNIHDYKENS